MSINSQPSSVKADGTGLADWLAQSGAHSKVVDGVTQLVTSDYNDLLKTDPWLEQFAESGAVALVDALAADTAGNGSSDSSNSSTSSNGSAQDQTAAESAAGADGTGDQDTALTLALSSFLKSAAGQFTESITPPEYTATQDVINAALAADPTVQLLIDNGTLAVQTASENTSASLVDRLIAAGIAYTTSEANGTDNVIYYVDPAAIAALDSEDPLQVYVASGALKSNVLGNAGTEPDANGNSQDATGSAAQLPVTDVVKQDDSSQQGSGSSSDASQSSNGASVVSGEPAGNGSASVDSGTTSSDAAGSGNAPSPAPVVIPPVPQPDPVVITAPITEASSAVAWLEEFAKTASVDAKAIINSILTYVRDMAPGKTQTPEAIQRQQMNLHVALTGAINRLDGEFKHVWGGVLKLFHEHRDGVFSERYVYRQLQNAPMNPQQRAAFQNVVNMIKLTADPQGRKVGLKQFDKARTMQHGLTEQGRNKLLAFYNL